MKNKYKVGYLISMLLDYILTFGGSAGIIIYNYVSESNSTGFKITITGIILLIGVIYVAKNRFEHGYQKTENTLLGELASASSEEVKVQIKAKLDKHHLSSSIYQKLTDILPLVIMYIVTYLGAQALAEMHGTLGWLLLSVGAGSVFNIIKAPLKEKADMVKYEKRANK